MILTQYRQYKHMILSDIANITKFTKQSENLFLFAGVVQKTRSSR